MTIIQALILSIIEGITEFLPISSTGHLILASHILKIPETEFLKSFEIIIQFGAILAVCVLYFQKIIRARYLWPKIIAAFLPAAIFGLVLYKLIKHFLLGNQFIVVVSLFLGGILLIFIDRLIKPKSIKLNDLSIKKSVYIGLFQTISIIPGVSRSASTIIGGLLTGLSKKEAVEFSFFLAIPTMAAATSLDLIQSSIVFTSHEITLLAIGFTGAFITAVFAVKNFIKYIQNHSFTYFGIYRIAVAIIYTIIFIR